MTRIARLFSADDVLLDVRADSKGALFDIVGDRMERELGIPGAWVSEALARREQIGSTALGQGFAIPHARVGHLSHIRLFYARLSPALEFGAPDRRPVTDALFILVPRPATEAHLQLLAEAAAMFGDRVFRQQLDHAGDASTVKALFDAWPHAPAANDAQMHCRGA